MSDIETLKHLCYTTERQVASACTTSPTHLRQSFEYGLSLEDLSDPLCKLAVVAARELFVEEGDFDTIGVMDRMATKHGGFFDGELGGPSALMELQASGYGVSLKQAVVKLTEYAARRRIYAIGGVAQNGAVDLARSPEDVTGQIFEEAMLATLGDESTVTTVTNIDTERLDAYRNGEGEFATFSTGIPGLDKRFRVVKGELTIVTGFPNSGKTTFTSTLLSNLAKVHDWKVLIWSAEASPEDMYLKLMEPAMGKPARNRDRHIHDVPVDADTIAKGAAWVASKFTLLDTRKRDRVTLSELLMHATLRMRTDPFDAIILDPWTQLTVEGRQDSAGMAQAHGDMLASYRRFAQRHNVAAFVVAHPRAQYEQGKVPRLTDINGSSQFANIADNGITVHRPALDPPVRGVNISDPNEVHIHITKVRNDHVGSIGKIVFEFDPRSRKFVLSDDSF